MEFKKNISLKNQNSFGINVNCNLYCIIKSKEDTIELIHSDEFKNNKTLILGGGSNLLFTKDFDGLIIKNEIVCKEVVSENKNNTTIKVGAGENWHNFVLWSIKNSGVINQITLSHR